jgi:hypothetical protein
MCRQISAKILSQILDLTKTLPVLVTLFHTDVGTWRGHQSLFAYAMQNGLKLLVCTAPVSTEVWHSHIPQRYVQRYDDYVTTPTTYLWSSGFESTHMSKTRFHVADYKLPPQMKCWRYKVTPGRTAWQKYGNLKFADQHILPILCALEKLRKATIIFVMCQSVRPPARRHGTTLLPLDGFW